MWCSTRWRAESAMGRAPACRLVLAIGLIGLAVPGLASTAEPSGMALSAQLSTPSTRGHLQLPGSRLQGEATLRYFGLRVYHARLWALPDFRASQPAEQPLLLELEYLRELKGNAIAERSLKEMQRLGRFTEAQAQRWLADMQRIFPDVKNGDRLSGLNRPGVGASFWLNGRPAGQIDDPEFARLFFGIWLAPTSSEPDLRLALLGQTDAGMRR